MYKKSLTSDNQQPLDDVQQTVFAGKVALTKTEEIWEILPQINSAVKIAKIVTNLQSIELLYGVGTLRDDSKDIESFLRKNGYKDIERISDYVVVFDEVMPKCSICGKNSDVTKAGRQTQAKSKHKRYYCKKCNCRFTVDRS